MYMYIYMYIMYNTKRGEQFVGLYRWFFIFYFYIFLIYFLIDFIITKPALIIIVQTWKCCLRFNHISTIHLQKVWRFRDFFSKQTGRRCISSNWLSQRQKQKKQRWKLIRTRKQLERDGSELLETDLPVSKFSLYPTFFWMRKYWMGPNALSRTKPPSFAINSYAREDSKMRSFLETAPGTLIDADNTRSWNQMESKLPTGLATFGLKMGCDSMTYGMSFNPQIVMWQHSHPTPQQIWQQGQIQFHGAAQESNHAVVSDRLHGRVTALHPNKQGVQNWMQGMQYRKRRQYLVQALQGPHVKR